jgi:hypothetical protein
MSFSGCACGCISYRRSLSGGICRCVSRGLSWSVRWCGCVCRCLGGSIGRSIGQSRSIGRSISKRISRRTRWCGGWLDDGQRACAGCQSILRGERSVEQSPAYRICSGVAGLKTERTSNHVDARFYADYAVITRIVLGNPMPIE